MARTARDTVGVVVRGVRDGSLRYCAEHQKKEGGDDKDFFHVGGLCATFF